MFTEVTKIRTKDGELFDTEEQAEDYVTDKICEEINETIKKTETYDLKHKDLLKIIMALSGTVENAQRLKAILDVYLD